MKIKITKEILELEHYNNKLTVTEIAEKYNYHPVTIRRYFKKFHLKLHWNRKHVFRKNIANQKFGKLIAIDQCGSTSSGRLKWNCLCDCGNMCIVTGKSLRQKHRTKCSRCYDKLIVPRWFFNNCKNSAKARKIKFEISHEQINKLLEIQNFKCNLSNIDIKFGKDRHDFVETTASIDRIDSSKGYIEGNIQWVHKDINYMKMDLKQENFIELCIKVANNVKSSK